MFEPVRDMATKHFEPLRTGRQLESARALPTAREVAQNGLHLQRLQRSEEAS